MTALVRAVASPAVDDHWPRRQSAEDPWPAKVEVCLHRLHEHLERLYRVLVAPILPAVHDREHWSSSLTDRCITSRGAHCGPPTDIWCRTAW
jgi:hypothetical protein